MKRRRGPAWIVGLLLTVGFFLILSGWFLQPLQYISDLLLSAGVTVGLVSPLFAVERTMQRRLARIEDNVSSLRKLLEFSDPSDSEFSQSINQLVGNYSRYLATLGLPTPETPPTVERSQEDTSLYYVPIVNIIQVPAAFVSDANAVLIQYTHHVLMSLPERSQPYLSVGARAVEEGLAWIMVCSFTGNPTYRHPERGLVDLREPWAFDFDDHRRNPEDYNWEAIRPVSATWAKIFWESTSLQQPSIVCAILISAFASSPGETDCVVWSDFAAAVAADVRWGVQRETFLDLLHERGVFLCDSDEDASQLSLFDLSSLE